MSSRVSVFVVVIAIVTAVYAGGDLSVKGAWVRESPPGSPNGVVYFSIVNPGQRDTLVGISVSDELADRAEFHTHKHEDGMMMMQRMESIEVPQGGAAVLEPHGNHVMLIGLKKLLKEGETIKLELKFEKADPVSLDVPVLRQAPPG